MSTIINDTITGLSTGLVDAYQCGIPLWVIGLAIIGIFAVLNMIPRAVLPSIYCFAYIWGFFKWVYLLIKQWRNENG